MKCCGPKRNPRIEAALQQEQASPGAYRVHDWVGPHLYIAALVGLDAHGFRRQVEGLLKVLFDQSHLRLGLQLPTPPEPARSTEVTPNQRGCGVLKDSAGGESP